MFLVRSVLLLLLSHLGCLRRISPRLTRLDTGNPTPTANCFASQIALPGPSPRKPSNRVKRVDPTSTRPTLKPHVWLGCGPGICPGIDRSFSSKKSQFRETWNAFCLKWVVRLKLPRGKAEREVSLKVVPMSKGRLNQSRFALCSVTILGNTLVHPLAGASLPADTLSNTKTPAFQP